MPRTKQQSEPRSFWSWAAQELHCHTSERPPHAPVFSRLYLPVCSPAGLRLSEHRNGCQGTGTAPLQTADPPPLTERICEGISHANLGAAVRILYIGRLCLPFAQTAAAPREVVAGKGH